MTRKPKMVPVVVPEKWAALVRNVLIEHARDLRSDTTVEAFGQTVPKTDSEIEQQNEWANALEDIANQLPRARSGSASGPNRDRKLRPQS